MSFLVIKTSLTSQRDKVLVFNIWNILSGAYSITLQSTWWQTHSYWHRPAGGSLQLSLSAHFLRPLQVSLLTIMFMSCSGHLFTVGSNFTSMIVMGLRTHVCVRSNTNHRYCCLFVRCRVTQVLSSWSINSVCSWITEDSRRKVLIAVY